MKSIKKAFLDYVEGESDVEKTGWFRFLVGVVYDYIMLVPRMLRSKLKHRKNKTCN